MIQFKYDETKDTIIAAHEDNFGRVREYDVTAQVMDVVAESFMAKGLAFAEHCEYEVNGDEFRICLVRDKATESYEPTKAVRVGKWNYIRTCHVGLIGADYDIQCSECGYKRGVFFKSKYCPNCGADMREN